MSRVLTNPAYYERTQSGTDQLISACVFATYIELFLYFLNPKPQPLTTLGSDHNLFKGGNRKKFLGLDCFLPRHDHLFSFAYIKIYPVLDIYSCQIRSWICFRIMDLPPSIQIKWPFPYAVVHPDLCRIPRRQIFSRCGVGDLCQMSDL